MANMSCCAKILTGRMSSPNNTLEVEYPIVSELSNLSVQNKINNEIYSLVNSLIVKQGYFQNPRTVIKGWHEIKSNERDVLSIALYNSSMPEQSMHGLTIIKCLTFNTQSGKVYKLKDLFKANSDYVKIISDKIRKQIKDRNIYMLSGFSGISGEQDFYIADKSLVVYFQLYELTSYAYGFPFFPISAFELAEIAEPNSPLGIMCVNY